MLEEDVKKHFFYLQLKSVFIICNQQYAPKPVEQVELLRGRPSKPFDVIADFQSRGESYESMRKRAAQIGADAIIITNLGGYASLTTQWAGDDPYSHYYSRLVGTVIKYK